MSLSNNNAPKVHLNALLKTSAPTQNSEMHQNAEIFLKSRIFDALKMHSKPEFVSFATKSLHEQQVLKNIWKNAKKEQKITICY